MPLGNLPECLWNSVKKKQQQMGSPCEKLSWSLHKKYQNYWLVNMAWHLRMNKSSEMLNIMRSLVFWEITCCHFELMNSSVQSPCSYHSAMYSTYPKSLKYFMWYFLENKIISSPYNLTFCCLPYLLSVKPYRINHLSNPVNLRNGKSDIAHGAVMEWNHNSAHLNPFNFSFLPWIEV